MPGLKPDPWTPPPMRRRRSANAWLLVVLLALGAGLLLFYGNYTATEALVRILGLGVLLFLFLPALFIGDFRRNVRHLAVWAGLFLVAYAGYSLWQQGQVGTAALTTALFSGNAVSQVPGAAQFRANRRGDFIIRASVNGVPVRFLVDTGASEVVLSQADARRVGLDPEFLNYVQRFQTANGIVFGAPVRLSEIVAGGVRVGNVRASVTSSDLGMSLLGMSFINRLSGFELSRGMLTLRQ